MVAGALAAPGVVHAAGSTTLVVVHHPTLIEMFAFQGECAQVRLRICRTHEKYGLPTASS